MEYTGNRKAFGTYHRPTFQNTQFKLAELKTDAVLGRVFTDTCIEQFMRGELTEVDAAMAKMWLSNLQLPGVADECLQLFGGWGYMWEYPIARAYADARIVKIAGGSIEVMKHIIGRALIKQAVTREYPRRLDLRTEGRQGPGSTARGRRQAVGWLATQEQVPGTARGQRPRK